MAQYYMPHHYSQLQRVCRRYSHSAWVRSGSWASGNLKSTSGLSERSTFLARRLLYTPKVQTSLDTETMQSDLLRITFSQAGRQPVASPWAHHATLESFCATVFGLAYFHQQASACLMNHHSLTTTTDAKTRSLAPPGRPAASGAYHNLNWLTSTPKDFDYGYCGRISCEHTYGQHGILFVEWRINSTSFGFKPIADTNLPTFAFLPPIGAAGKHACHAAHRRDQSWQGD
jgi:hypothetical protein